MSKGNCWSIPVFRKVRFPADLFHKKLEDQFRSDTLQIRKQAVWFFCCFWVFPGIQYFIYAPLSISTEESRPLINGIIRNALIIALSPSCCFLFSAIFWPQKTCINNLIQIERADKQLTFAREALGKNRKNNSGLFSIVQVTKFTSWILLALF